MKIFFSAGEPSGDLHGANLIRELRRQRPDFEAVGYGGPEMAAAGCDLHADLTQLAVMWFLRVLLNLHKFLNLASRADRFFQHHRPDAVVLIDYPGFNMKLAAAGKAAGVPVLYYVTPQVWAWGAGRIPKLAEYVAKAAVILPFEEALLRGYGVDATFVGHPMLDRTVNMPTKVEARVALGLAQNAPVLALFPGSRQQEIDRHIDAFVATAKELQRRIPGLQVLVSVAPTVALDANRCPTGDWHVPGNLNYIFRGLELGVGT